MRTAANTHRALKQDEVKEKVITELLEDVLASDNLALAWKRVKANKGAPGIDGMTVEDFPAHARAHWPAVRQQIRDGRYRPQAVRRVEIPKPDGGKRMLGIPTVMDRMIQQAIAQVLTPIFDPTFSESSFGFRPGRNAHQAIRQVQGRRLQVGEPWASHAPRSGCPQARPVGRWLVHGGRVFYDAAQFEQHPPENFKNYPQIPLTNRKSHPFGSQHRVSYPS